MPYKIVSPCAQCPTSKPHGVVNAQTGKVVPGGCHPTKADAKKHLSALNMNVQHGGDGMDAQNASRSGCTGRERVERLRAVATHLRKGNRRQLGRVDALAADLGNMALRQHVQGEIAWRAGADRVQSLDELLATALELFERGEADLGVDAIVAQSPVVASGMQAMGLPMSEASEPEPEPEEAPAEVVEEGGEPHVEHPEPRSVIAPVPSSREAPALGSRKNGRPPREGLVRGVFRTEFRGTTFDAAPSSGPTLFGHFAVFDVWTEIDSFWEGNFMESLAPGCFDKTVAENRSQIRCLFQHGHDPQIGSKVLGPISELKAEKKGMYYEVPMYDTSYNRDLLPGLADNQYGASFRFRVLREEVAEEPGTSKYNPKGIPERRVTELELMEFGPVTFAQYPEATAGVRSDGAAMRSLTDDVILLQLGLTRDKMEEFVAHYLQHQVGAAPRHSAEEPHPVDGAARPPMRSLTVVRNPHKG